MAASEQPTPEPPALVPPTPSPPSPTDLLAKALESLASDERQRVTAWLLARRVSGSASGSSSLTELGMLGWRSHDDQPHIPGPSQEALREMYERRFGTASVFGRGQQVVPVRLPTELHSRLRSWCADHGFSMATVVRGLVARFLDGQVPVEADPAPPAEPLP
jgi:hypothetical protein